MEVSFRTELEQQISGGFVVRSIENEKAIVGSHGSVNVRHFNAEFLRCHFDCSGAFRRFFNRLEALFCKLDGRNEGRHSMLYLSLGCEILPQMICPAQSEHSEWFGSRPE